MSHRPVVFVVRETPLRPVRRHSPRVTLIEWKGRSAVKKCYAHCPFWLRHSVGRLALSRESWALSRLEFSRHTPLILDRPKPYTLIMEYVDGTPLEELDPTGEYPNLESELDSLLEDLSQACVVHGDLGHDHWHDWGRESNLIWTGRGELKAIDFAGSLPLAGDGLLALRPLRRLCQALHHHDLLLKTKVQKRFGKEQKPSVALHWPVDLWELLRLLGKL